MTTPTTVPIRLKLRQDTAANWTSTNPTLLAGELGRESDTGKIKIGNGSTAWTSLAYQPFGAQITNADISATAEIAVSKLADGAARQLLQTDAAGTGVEWTDNVDIPGTLDVTGAATFDGAVTVAGDLTVNGTTTNINTQNLVVEDKNIILGDVTTPSDVTADGGGITLKGATDKTINWVDATDAWTSSERFSVPLGSASLPSLTFTGDENSGLYSPGADQVAIATGGTGRLFIDSSGRLLVGTSQNISSYRLQVVDTNPFDGLRYSATAGGPVVRLAKSRSASVGSYAVVSSGDTFGTFDFAGDDGSAFITGARISAFVDGTPGTNDMPGRIVLSTTPSGSATPVERLRITNAGNVGIGTSTPAAIFTVLDSASVYPGMFRSTSSSSYITFGNSGTANNFHQGIGAIGADLVALAGNSERLRITSAGLVGIGTSAPAFSLDVTGAGAQTIRVNTTDTSGTNTGRFVALYTGGGGGTQSQVDLLSGNGFSRIGTSTNTPLTFTTNGLERCRIDSSGRLLVGTSTSSGGALFQVNGDRIRVGTAKTPASSSDTGTAGEICWDADYVYVCTATNTWKRTAIATW